MSKANDQQYGGTHYKGPRIQPWDITALYNLDYFEGNVIKYLLREKDDRLTDLKKARHYLDKRIELEEAHLRDEMMLRVREDYLTSERTDPEEPLPREEDFYAALADECERRRAEADSAFVDYIRDRIDGNYEDGTLSNMEKKLSRSPWGNEE